jgi:hypothetical protein
MLSEHYLQKLLAESLKQVALPADCAIGLEGSLAEGFGNESSDIDFIVIDDRDGEAAHKTMPALLFIDGRRIEVRVRSRAQVRAQIAELRRSAGRGGRGGSNVPEDLLDRCQRLKRALPLRAVSRLRAIQDLLPDTELSRIVCNWFTSRAAHAARCAAVLLRLGRMQEAASWGRVAANQSAKAWAAAHHETYLSPKWLTQQLGRISGGSWMLERFGELDSPVSAESDPAGYVRECIAFARNAGVPRIEDGIDGVTVSAARHVTTWQIGRRVHVVRNREAIFALSTPAARVWRALAFGFPLASMLSRLDEEERGFLADLHRLGLIHFRWRGAGRIVARGACGAVPSQGRPVLSIDGAVLSKEDEAICRAHLLPLPAVKFASAGMALMWSNMMIENAVEDAVGALASQQWGTLENTARRMLREACLCILSSLGMSPLPHAEEAVACLAQLAEVPEDVRQRALDLSFRLRIRNAQQARDCLDDLAVFVQRARELASSATFPSCFESAGEWRHVIELGYDWARMGAYLDSNFPYEEVRDLLATTGKGRGVAAAEVGKSTQEPLPAVDGCSLQPLNTLNLNAAEESERAT